MMRPVSQLVGALQHALVQQPEGATRLDGGRAPEPAPRDVRGEHLDKVDPTDKRAVRRRRKGKTVSPFKSFRNASTRRTE